MQLISFAMMIKNSESSTTQQHLLALKSLPLQEQKKKKTFSVSPPGLKESAFIDFRFFCTTCKPLMVTCHYIFERTAKCQQHFSLSFIVCQLTYHIVRLKSVCVCVCVCEREREPFSQKSAILLCGLCALF